jgi:hypothetical protein
VQPLKTALGGSHVESDDNGETIAPGASISAYKAGV